MRKKKRTAVGLLQRDEEVARSNLRKLVVIAKEPQDLRVALSSGLHLRDLFGRTRRETSRERFLGCSTGKKTHDTAGIVGAELVRTGSTGECTNVSRCGEKFDGLVSCKARR